MKRLEIRHLSEAEEAAIRKRFGQDRDLSAIRLEAGSSKGVLVVCSEHPLSEMDRRRIVQAVRFGLKDIALATLIRRAMGGESRWDRFRRGLANIFGKEPSLVWL